VREPEAEAEAEEEEEEEEEMSTRVSPGERRTLCGTGRGVVDVVGTGGGASGIDRFADMKNGLEICELVGGWAGRGGA
jgi:hypothetical protein